jgi:hypothetical protein
MNVTFTENFGSAKMHNTTKYYGAAGITLQPNSTFSDVMMSNINHQPGKYNISIYFDYGEINSVFTDWNSTYALANRTLTIVGATQSIKIIQGFAIALAAISAFVVIIVIYNKIKK